MISVKSPLRLPLGGGGTDLPSFYQQHGAFFISAAINLHVRVRLKEGAPHVNLSNNKIVKMAIKRYGETQKKYSLQSFSDVASGSGLGGSASFTTALILALHTLKQSPLSKEELAEKAFSLEHDDLGLSCGKQDQYSTVFADLRSYEISPDGTVHHQKLPLSPEFHQQLEESLLLVETGITRKSELLLKEQREKSQQQDRKMIENLLAVKAMGYESHKALLSEDLSAFAMLMKEHWEIKKARSSNMSCDRIDELYQFGLSKGALSGKLIGAGGGGYLLFCIKEREKLINDFRAKNIKVFPLRFESSGTQVL